MKHIESNIQQAFVSWFRFQYPQFALNLTSVPNGGYRNAREAAILKREGMTAGAADILILVPSGGFGALGIEFKTLEKNSKQSDAQIKWQHSFEKAGNKYILIRTLDDAIEATVNYLSRPKPTGRR